MVLAGATGIKEIKVTLVLLDLTVQNGIDGIAGATGIQRK
jgi:hypothetical protein